MCPGRVGILYQAYYNGEMSVWNEQDLEAQTRRAIRVSANTVLHCTRYASDKRPGTYSSTTKERERADMVIR